MSRQALGRGLRALIPEGSLEPARGEGIREVAVDRVAPNPYQPRRQFSEENLQELAESIRVHGVLEPVVVRPAADGEGERYQLVIGERRWRAAQMAGLSAVPVVVRRVSDREMVQMALVENLQREDLNPMEEAEAYRRLIQEFGMSQEQVAEFLGRARPTIANSLRLLELEEPVRRLLEEGRLTAGHGKALLGLPAGPQRVRLAQRVAERGLSVRQTEELVRQLTEKAPARDEPRAGTGRPWAQVEASLERVLGTRVTIRQGRKGGRIEIAFYGDEELWRLLELFARLDRDGNLQDA